MRTRVHPDPRHVKWVNPTIRRGRTHDVVLTIGEGGGMWALDSRTGRFLWARPFPYDDPNLNVNRIDVRTGRTHVNADKLFRQDGDQRIVCYHNTRTVMQVSYNPENNALYVPFHDSCLSMTADTDSPVGFGPRFGIIRPGADPARYMNIGRIDVSTGEMRVIYSQPQGTNGSLLTTAGGLLFTGTSDGYVKAFDAKTGKEVWKFQTGSGVISVPITWEQDGEQYIGIASGYGGAVPLWGGDMAELTKQVNQGGSFWAFKLPKR